MDAALHPKSLRLFRMKFVRLGLIISSLFALSACCSWEELRRFHAWPAKPVDTTQPAPTTTPTPAEPAPAVPETTPVPAPVAPATPAEPVGASSAPAVVAPVAPATFEAAPVNAPVATESTVASTPLPALHATRTGAVVTLDWTLPPASVGYRSIEIMRNTSDAPRGRTRVKSVHASVTHFDETLADANAIAWYWLKLTNADATIQNFGPVQAK